MSNTFKSIIQDVSNTEYEEINEALKAPVAFYASEDSQIPQRVIVLFEIEGTNYGVQFIKSSTKGLYKVFPGRMNNKKFTLMRIKPQHLKMFLATTIAITQSFMGMFYTQVTGLALMVPKKTTRSLMRVAGLAAKRNLKQYLIPLAIDNTKSSDQQGYQYLFFLKKGIDSRSVFNRKEFKGYFDDETGMLSSEALDNLQTTKQVKPSVSEAPSKKIFFHKVADDQVELDTANPDFVEKVQEVFKDAKDVTDPAKVKENTKKAKDTAVGLSGAGSLPPLGMGIIPGNTSLKIQDIAYESQALAFKNSLAFVHAFAEAIGNASFNVTQFEFSVIGETENRMMLAIPLDTWAAKLDVDPNMYKNAFLTPFGIGQSASSASGLIISAMEHIIGDEAKKLLFEGTTKIYRAGTAIGKPPDSIPYYTSSHKDYNKRKATASIWLETRMSDVITRITSYKGHPIPELESDSNIMFDMFPKIVSKYDMSDSLTFAYAVLGKLEKKQFDFTDANTNGKIALRICKMEDPGGHEDTEKFCVIELFQTYYQLNPSAYITPAGIKYSLDSAYKVWAGLNMSAGKSKYKYEDYKFFSESSLVFVNEFELKTLKDRKSTVNDHFEVGNNLLEIAGAIPESLLKKILVKYGSDNNIMDQMKDVLPAPEPEPVEPKNYEIGDGAPAYIILSKFLDNWDLEKFLSNPTPFIEGNTGNFGTMLGTKKQRENIVKKLQDWKPLLDSGHKKTITAYKSWLSKLKKENGEHEESKAEYVKATKASSPPVTSGKFEKHIAFIEEDKLELDFADTTINQTTQTAAREDYNKVMKETYGYTQAELHEKVSYAGAVAARYYTTSEGASMMNSLLRSVDQEHTKSYPAKAVIHQGMAKMNVDVATVSEALMEQMQKLPPTKRDYKVYRKSAVPFAAALKIQETKTFCDYGFLSTTLRNNKKHGLYISDYGNIVDDNTGLITKKYKNDPTSVNINFEIAIPKGTVGPFPIRGYSEFKSELEVLLPPGAVLKLIRSEIKKHGDAHVIWWSFVMIGSVGKTYISKELANVARDKPTSLAQIIKDGAKDKGLTDYDHFLQGTLRENLDIGKKMLYSNFRNIVGETIMENEKKKKEGRHDKDLVGGNTKKFLKDVKDGKTSVKLNPLKFK